MILYGRAKSIDVTESYECLTFTQLYSHSCSSFDDNLERDSVMRYLPILDSNHSRAKDSLEQCG